MLKNGEGKSSDLDAEIIAERCIEFAMYVTSGVREITGDSSNESTDKTELFEVAINKWLTENKAVMENKSTPLSFISPFAKPDHLGLVCAKVGIID